MLRRVLLGYLFLLMPVAWLAMKYDRYAIDGDAVSYMDIADLLHAHRWSGAVNAYWHPLYPAVLWLGQVLFRPTRATELHAYYVMNFCLFLAQIAAMLLFVRVLVRLRERVSPAVTSLFATHALQLLGLSLLVIGAMRELTLGKVRTDGLLQALILLGLAMLMQALADDRVRRGFAYASLMGLCFGLAYLTKSFAFLLVLLCTAALVLFGVLVLRRPLVRTVAQGIVALVAFGIVAGPYIAALSHQKHRFDFGDSGTLNYVWYVSGTEKMHLEPWMTGSFGSATVHLVHPERQLLSTPGVYSYKALADGTYPPWFDATYFNERITPKFSPALLLRRDTRNVVLILRYLLNHPEPLILLAILLLAGATLRGSKRFAWVPAGMGLAMWGIYAMVNVEERYVTVAYFAVLLPIFAALKARDSPAHPVESTRRIATAVLLFFAVLTLGEWLREDLANRREESVAGQVPAWRSANIYGAAEGLARMGVKPGDEIACIGTGACLYDPYWARLAGVRVLTEIYDPLPDHLIERLDAMPDREHVFDVVQHEGARVVVGMFDPGEMNATHPAAAGWLRLGETTFYARPLH